MPSVTGLGITSGLLARARRRWRGARSSGAFLQAGGLRNERCRFFALGRLFHRVRRDGGRAGSFCCVGDLEGGAMKPEEASLLVQAVVRDILRLGPAALLSAIGRMP